MGYGIKLKLFGDYACFTRPEMKAERVSYDVITPSAARGIIEAIHWKPAIKWVIDKIHVINEICYANIRRNEVGEKIKLGNIYNAINNDVPLFLNSNKDRQQRASLVLKNVCYFIEAHFELTEKAGETDTPEKHYAIFSEKAKKGKCFYQPCFGTREFSAHFEYCEHDIPQSHYQGEIDLGYMLFDLNYRMKTNGERSTEPVYFRAIMNNGIIDVGNAVKVK